MDLKTDKLPRQTFFLWKKSISQLEKLAGSFIQVSGLERIKFNRAKLLTQRDQLLQRLGEETVKLIDQHRIKVPINIQGLHMKIRKLTDRLMTREKQAGKTSKKTT